MKVVIIGSGNVAAVLGRKISLAGHEILEVAGRNAERVKAIANGFNCNYTLDLLSVTSLGDIYIICVSDNAIGGIASELKLKSELVVHTAAGVSIDVLRGVSENYGILYPLQSLKNSNPNLPAIPILIDGNNENSKARLSQFAADWAHSVSVAGDEERVKLHLAAVFANNFVNHIFAVCQQYCRDNSLDYNLLGPIIEETITRIRELPALRWQTGPAVRRDWITMAKHEALLRSDKDSLEVYKVLSNSIIAYNNGTNR